MPAPASNNAKVTVIETEAEYKRDLDTRQRSKFQIVSQHDVDTAKAAYDRAVVAVTTAEASVTQAEANLKIDETNVNFAVIKSPVDGIVLSRSVEPGQTIAASFSVTTLFEIAEDLRKMILQVNIDEADVGKVKVGQHVLFTVDAYPGRQFPGTITIIRYSSTTTNNVVTYLAEISVNNDELLLRPGMTATATITVQSIPNALLVSNHALRFLPSASDTDSSSTSFLPGPPGLEPKCEHGIIRRPEQPARLGRAGRKAIADLRNRGRHRWQTHRNSSQVRLRRACHLIVEVLKEGK